MVWPAGEAAFITGAASGMGLGTARALIAAGAKVALADIDAETLVRVADELRAQGGDVIAVPLDVTDAQGWEVAADAAEAKLGPISILAQFAGVSGGRNALEDTKQEIWQWVFRINAEAQFLGTATFLPRMRARGGRAHLLNTASMAGVIPFVDSGAYVASKFASVGMTLVLQEELRGTDIGVSVLCPGTVATRLGRTAEELQARLEGREPNEELIGQLAQGLSVGADPDVVGEQVVEGMRAGELFIFTHATWRELTRHVSDAIESGFDHVDDRNGVDPTAVMMIEGLNPVTASRVGQ